MSEYKTLDQWFPDGRGDGRKFTTDGWNVHAWIEPIFISKPCQVYDTTWHCLDENGTSNPILREMLHTKFKEWHPPKKTKKVILYRPVYLGYEKTYCSIAGVGWHSDKYNWVGCKDKIVGWMTMEVEVDDE